MPRIGRSFPTHVLIVGPVATNLGYTIFTGAASLTAVSTMTAGATLAQVVSAALSAAGTLTDTGYVTTSATVAMSASSVLTDTPFQTNQASAALSAAGSLTLAPTQTSQASATLSAAGSMTIGAPTQTQFPVAALTAAGSLSANPGAGIFSVSASLTALGSLAATGQLTQFPVTNLTALGSLLAGATLIQPAAVSLAASGSLNAAATQGQFALVSMSATGSLVIQLGRVVMGAATLVATGSLIAFVAGSNVFPVANLVATGILSAHADILIRPVPSEAYYLRDPQNWAVAQERQRHAQALYSIGEMAIFVLMWHVLDFDQGLVQRCATCYSSTNSLNNRITAVYNQPTKSKCPDCLGTTFQGGFRALILRPTIITDVDEKEKPDQRGVVHPSDISVETTWDFRSREGDYLIRADNSRWRLDTPERIMLRTGFTHPSQASAAITYGNIRAHLEAPSTVAYLIPPTASSQINFMLTQNIAQVPPNLSAFEVLNGPLVVPSLLD